MSDYSDILNRKKTSDKLGDAFSKQADSMRPMNVGQRREQALLRGLGVGLNNDDEREAKLAELEEDYKQVDMLNRQLQMSSGKNQLTKAQNENFFLSNRNDLATMNGFLANGDFEAVNLMSPTLIENYKKITGRDIGEYAYSRNGKIYLENGKGEVKGQYLAEILQGIIPESEQMNFPELLTYNSKQAVQAKMDEQRLKNEQIRAAIDASYASAELHRSQGYKARNEMGELEKMKYQNQLAQQGEVNKSRLKVNNEYLEGLSKENSKASNILPILDEFYNLLTTSPDLFGSSKWAEAKRAIAKFTGDDAPIQRANYLQKYFFPEIKGIAGNPNQREWTDLVGKIISESQNVDAALTQIALDKKILQGKQREFNNYSKVLSGTDHNYYYYDPEITSRIKRMEKDGVLVKVKAPDGSIKEIPEEQAQIAISQGKGVLVNE